TCWLAPRPESSRSSSSAPPTGKAASGKSTEVRGLACQHVPVLQVRGLAVEVAGRVLVEDVSFTIRARDKVGLVGRNGAGQASLLRILGGGAPAHAGVVHRKGALGYLSQDPKLDGIADDISGLTHVLSGKGFDETLVRMEKLRLRLEEDP